MKKFVIKRRETGWVFKRWRGRSARSYGGGEGTGELGRSGSHGGRSEVFGGVSEVVGAIVLGGVEGLKGGGGYVQYSLQSKRML